MSFSPSVIFKISQYVCVEIKNRVMEKITIGQDSTLMCVTATSFPEGVLAAHQQLHSLIPFSTQRKYYGISYGGANGTIIYKAAAEELTAGEAEEKKLETYLLRKGEYNSILIKNYMDDIPAIGKAFTKLLASPDLDPNGCCVEWYLNDKDVQCMVQLTDNINQ
jgi:predicted transcriptional regulator YdeE